MKQIEDWGFFLIVAVMVAGASILIATDSLPEKAAAHFNALTDVIMDTNYRVIKKPSPTHNTFIYELNDVAEKSISIAEMDPWVSDIIKVVLQVNGLQSQQSNQLYCSIETMDSLHILAQECS